MNNKKDLICKKIKSLFVKSKDEDFCEILADDFEIGYFKRFEIVIYAKDLKADIKSVLSEDFYICKYAYILHNKNCNSPHYHIYLDYGDKYEYIEFIAEAFSIPISFINIPFSTNWKCIFDYFLSYNDYSVSDIVANFDISDYLC